MTEEKTNTMRVILCKPGEKAETIEMEDSLRAMQEMVGGRIEEYMPWEEEVAIICNEEGKMMGLPMNRALRDEDEQIYDVICGTFFLCAAPPDEENFCSLSDEQIDRFTDLFRHPELFV